MVSNNANNANTPEVVFPELSYQIVGSAFSVLNELGYGLPEKAYQDGLEREFTERGLEFQREPYLPLSYHQKYLSRYFADFVVAEKIVVETKVVKKLGYTQVKQVLGYLRSSGMKLGILIYFTSEGVKYRRILNSKVSA